MVSHVVSMKVDLKDLKQMIKSYNTKKSVVIRVNPSDDDYITLTVPLSSAQLKYYKFNSESNNLYFAIPYCRLCNVAHEYSPWIMYHHNLFLEYKEKLIGEKFGKHYCEE